MCDDCLNGPSRERYRAYWKAYDAARAERKRTYDREQYHRDPARYFAYVANRRARAAAAAGSLTAAEWLAIIRHQRGRCAVCSEVKSLTRDHIVPLSRGGSNYACNIQGLCRSCNGVKRDRLPAGTQFSIFDDTSKAS